MSNLSVFTEDIIKASGLQAKDVLGDVDSIHFSPYLTQDHYDYFDKLLKEKERIIIHGDYDGDGLCGTAILYKYLKESGFNVFIKIPKRSEGYGINPSFPDLVKATDNPALVITVDCGISNKAEIDRGKELGIDFIVTDHHELPDQLPDAKYIFHPFILTDNEDIKYLSGTGMAFWLAWQLNIHYQTDFDFDSWSSVAAIGLISDYVPLLGKTRELVKYGIKMIRTKPPVGMKALIDANQINQDWIDEEALSFGVIPRLNAAGRLSDPILAFSILTTDDYFSAARASVRLDELNEKRKVLTQKYIDDAIYRLNDVEEDKMTFIIANDWLHGIVGITSAKLVNLYELPSFVLCREGQIYKGSARSPEWFDIMEALHYAGEYTLRYGGHKHAGGFTLRPDQVLRFKFALTENAQQQFLKARNPQKVIEWKKEYDQFDIVEEIKQMQPFGVGFPKPLFLIKDQPLTYVRPSMDQKHLFCEVNKIKSVYWSAWNTGLTNRTPYDIVFKLGLDTWKSETPTLKAELISVKEKEFENDSIEADIHSPTEENDQE